MTSSSRGSGHTNEQPDLVEDRLLGLELGSYRLVERLGEGASAVVYRGEHIRLKIPYAIKILHPMIASRKGMRERFLREAQAAGSLRHENVVFVADFAIDPQIGPYMVMEYLEGETLQSVLEREGALPTARILRIAQQICKALSVAHEVGIIHRDLKPENIFLLSRKGEDTVKILDFGIARLAQSTHHLTGAGNVVGTPLYMSPEQCRGDVELTASSDIYSFGVMLFQMLTGQTPFRGDHPQKLLIDHFLVPAPPLPPHFSEPLRRLQASLLAKTPEERPHSMERVSQQLESALQSHSLSIANDPDADLTDVFRSLPDALHQQTATQVKQTMSGAERLMAVSGQIVQHLDQKTPYELSQTPPPRGTTQPPPLFIGAPAESLLDPNRQTLESLPAVTPQHLQQHLQPIRVEQRYLPDNTEDPMLEELDKLLSESREEAAVGGHPRQTQAKTGHTDEELLKDLRLYASTPTPPSSHAWPAEAEARAWESPISAEAASHRTDPALDHLLDLSVSKPPKDTARTEVHVAAYMVEDNDDTALSLDKSFHSQTRTELRVPQFYEEEMRKKRKRLFFLLSITGGVFFCVFVFFAFLRSPTSNTLPKEIPPVEGLSSSRRPTTADQTIMQAAKKRRPCQRLAAEQICLDLYSTLPNTIFALRKQELTLPGGQYDALCACLPKGGYLSLNLANLSTGENLTYEPEIALHEDQQIVFDLQEKRYRAYPWSKNSNPPAPLLALPPPPPSMHKEKEETAPREESPTQERKSASPPQKRRPTPRRHQPPPQDEE